MTPITDDDDSVIIIVGPTAVGKTKLSIQLAKALGDAEIISADSMQVYRQFDIGSAKVTESEMDGIRHHLISIIDPSSTFTVRDFVRLGRAALADILSRGKRAIIVGGTCYYILALLTDKFVSSDQNDSESAFSLDDQLLKIADLHSLLFRLDPERAAKLHPNDSRRIRRSLEVITKTGRSHSDALSSFSHRVLYRCFCIWLDAPDSTIEQRISDRVCLMMNRGLIRENFQIYKQLPCSETMFEIGVGQAIGFKEFRQCYDSDFESAPDRESREAEAASALRRATRRYAHRQVRMIAKHLAVLPGIIVARFDTSDARHWDSVVLQPAIKCCRQFLAGVVDTTDDIFSASMISRLKYERPMNDTAPWRKFTCHFCSRKVLNGEHEYSIHLSSRSHRRQLSKQKKADSRRTTPFLMRSV